MEPELDLASELVTALDRIDAVITRLAAQPMDAGQVRITYRCVQRLIQILQRLTTALDSARRN